MLRNTLASFRLSPFQFECPGMEGTFLPFLAPSASFSSSNHSATLIVMAMPLRALGGWTLILCKYDCRPQSSRRFFGAGLK